MKQSYLISLTVLGTAIAGLVLGTNLGGHEGAGGSETAPLALASAMPAAPDSSAAPAAAADWPAMTPMDRASIWLNGQFGNAAAPAEAVQEAAIPPVQEPETELAQNAAPAAAAEPEEQPAAAEPAPAADTNRAAAPAAEAAKPAEAEAAPAAPAKTAAAAAAPERGILNGYKGYRHHRPGYQSAGDGWWYPRAAFAGQSEIAQFMQTEAAQIAAPLAAPAAAPVKAGPAVRKTAAEKAGPRHAVRLRLSEAQLLVRHMQWCAARHPSYNKRDNSYRETFDKHYCVSPYSRQLNCR